MAQPDPHREQHLPKLPPLRSQMPPPPPPLRQHHSTPLSPKTNHLINRFQAFVPGEHSSGRGSFPRPPSPQYPPQPYSQGLTLYDHNHIPQQTSPRPSPNRAPLPLLHPPQHSPRPAQPTQRPHQHYWHPELPALNRTSPMRFSRQPQSSSAPHPHPSSSSYYSPPPPHIPKKDQTDERLEHRSMEVMIGAWRVLRWKSTMLRVKRKPKLNLMMIMSKA